MVQDILKLCLSSGLIFLSFFIVLWGAGQLLRNTKNITDTR